MYLRIALCLPVLACIGLLAPLPTVLSGQAPAPGQARPQGARAETYRQLAEGVLVSSEPVFTTDSLPHYRIQVQNLVLGPNQNAPQVHLEGFALMELRSGTLEMTIDGKSARQETGTSWFVHQGARLALRNVSEVAIIRTTTFVPRK
jgi:hypothetical protein